MAPPGRNGPPHRGPFRIFGRAYLSSASTPAPASLGAVELIGHGLRGDLEVATMDGSCSTIVDAVSVSIELAPSTDASPWLPLLMFETLVDGMPWTIRESLPVVPPPGTSWQGRGRDLLFRICEAEHASAYPGLSHRRSPMMRAVAPRRGRHPAA